MVVPEVDDAVALGDGPSKTAGVIQGAKEHLGTVRGDGGRRGVRTGEAEDLVAGAEQFRHDGRTDPARRSGDEYSHDDLLGVLGVDEWDAH